MSNAQQPDAPSRRWLVLLGLAMTYAVTNGVLIHTLPLLYPYLIESFGWTRTQVTQPATAFLIIAAVTSPPAGAVLDRYSARTVIAVGLIGITASLLGYAVMSTLTQLTVVYVAMAVSLSLSGLVSNMLILSRWFVHLRGRATGLLLMASSIGGAAFPWLLGYCVEHYGWRVAMQVLAITVILIALLPLLVLVRDRPKQSLTSTAETESTTAPIGPSVKQALRQPGFYLVAVATAAVWFSIIAMVQHQSIYLAGDMGIAKSRLPSVFSAFFLCSVIGKLLFGWLSDRFDNTLMMLGSIAILALGLLILRSVNAAGDLSLYGYAMTAGIGFSGAFTMIQLMFANLYAGQSFGKILAILMMIDTLSGALGTRVVARIRDITGHYLPAIDLMIGLLVFASVCIAIISRTQRAGRAQLKGHSI